MSGGWAQEKPAPGWAHVPARGPATRLPPASSALCRSSSNATFREVLREIEQRPACGGLPLISFLILPMQRVTRLPLLTDVSALPRAPPAGRHRSLVTSSPGSHVSALIAMVTWSQCRRHRPQNTLLGPAPTL